MRSFKEDACYLAQYLALMGAILSAQKRACKGILKALALGF